MVEEIPQKSCIHISKRYKEKNFNARNLMIIQFILQLPILATVSRTI